MANSVANEVAHTPATVAARSGGVPDLITHGVDGYMEPVGDVAAQAQRVTELLSDEALFERISMAARQKAVNRFCTSLIIPEYEEYYREVRRG